MRFAILIMLVGLTACGEEMVVEKITQVHPNGNAKSVMIFNEDETERLYHYVYYANAKLKMEGSYSQDKKHGAWKSYFTSGALWTVNNYKMDILDGEYWMYNDVGTFQETPQTVRISGQYINGEESGVWNFYDDKGEFVQERDYDLE